MIWRNNLKNINCKIRDKIQISRAFFDENKAKEIFWPFLALTIRVYQVHRNSLTTAVIYRRWRFIDLFPSSCLSFFSTVIYYPTNEPSIAARISVRERMDDVLRSFSETTFYKRMRHEFLRTTIGTNNHSFVFIFLSLF